jgi:hypothetical protein
MPASTVVTASMLTAAGPGVGLRRRYRVAKDIEVYTHYCQEGGVDYQVDWQLSWFVGMLRRPGLTIAVTVWTNTTNTLRWIGGVHAIEPEIWPC